MLRDVASEFGICLVSFFVRLVRLLRLGSCQCRNAGLGLNLFRESSEYQAAVKVSSRFAETSSVIESEAPLHLMMV